MLKPTLLSISMLTVMAGAAVAPGLADIAIAFPETSPTLIKLILTLPALFVIPFSLLSGRLSTRLPKKFLLLLGLCLYVVGGIGGGWADSIVTLLFCRAVLGVGVGLIMPLATGLIADFCTGNERIKMMGLSTAASNLGGIVATLIAGLLAERGWRLPFGVYGLGLVVILLVLIFLPKTSRSGAEGDQAVPLPPKIYAWGVGVLFLMLAFYALPVNTAIFIKNAAIGDAETAGFALSLMSAAGFLGGLSLSPLRRLLGGLLPLFLVGLMGSGYLTLSNASTLPEVLTGLTLAGIGFGWLLPTLFLGAVNAAPPGMGVPAMAAVGSMGFLGQFLSPIVLDALGRLFGDTSARFNFIMVAFCLGALGFLLLLSRLWTGRSITATTTETA